MKIEVQRVESTWSKGYFYNHVLVDGVDVQDYPADLENMAKLIKVMESIDPSAEYPTIGGDAHEGDTTSGDTILELLEEEAQAYADALEVEFIYQKDGVARQYTPECMWEASGGCSWEESAQYGYDFGWDV